MPPSSLFANCRKHPGTETWVGDGGTMAFIHGFTQQWCKVCVLETQLAHARKLAAMIPELEQKLREASNA